MKKELAQKLGEIVSLLLMEDAEDAPKIEQGMMPQAAQMPPPNYQAVGGPPRPAARQVAPPGTPPAPMADPRAGLWPTMPAMGNDDFHPDTIATIKQMRDDDPFPTPDGFQNIREHLFSMTENETHLNVIKEIDDAVKAFIASGFKEIDVSKFPKEFINYLDKCIVMRWEGETTWATATLNHCDWQTRQKYGCDRLALGGRDQIIVEALRKMYAFTQEPPKKSPWPCAYNQPLSQPVPIPQAQHSIPVQPDGSVPFPCVSDASASIDPAAVAKIMGDGLFIQEIKPDGSKGEVIPFNPDNPIFPPNDVSQHPTQVPEVLF